VIELSKHFRLETSSIDPVDSAGAPNLQHLRQVNDLYDELLLGPDVPGEANLTLTALPKDDVADLEVVSELLAAIRVRTVKENVGAFLFFFLKTRYI
jgi:hypothetical protein